MSKIAIAFGILLVALGGALFGMSELEGPKKYTALIPSAFGLVLIVCGIIARNDNARKHAMHAAAMVGLIGTVMPLVRVVPGLISRSADNPIKLAEWGQLGMAGLCGVFVVLCVKSFIDVRKARKLAEAKG